MLLMVESSKGVIVLNVVFWLIVGLAVVCLWFVFSFLFKPIGKYIVSLINDAKENMKD